MAQVFPKQILKMIVTGRSRGQNSRQISDRINSSATATKLGLTYTPQQVAGRLAKLSRDENTQG